MSASPKSVNLDPQFKQVMANYLSSQPYNQVKTLIDGLLDDKPQNTDFLQQLDSVLVKEVSVRLHMAIQQALVQLSTDNTPAPAPAPEVKSKPKSKLDDKEVVVEASK
jgi:hypothetical protein